MKVLRDVDIWSFVGKVDAICITTNGYVANDGTAVMGRGVAKQAMERIKGIDRLLGEYIRVNGNCVGVLCKYPGTDTWIVSFPVKPAFGLFGKCEVVSGFKTAFYKKLDKIPGWAVKADFKLIERSAKRLVEVADERGWKQIVVPAPGCGNGGRKWEDVKPILEKYFDDRFIVVMKN